MKTLFLISLIAFAAFMGMRIVNGIEYGQECSGHLKRAADANTVDMAVEELETAISYIEAKGLTEGYTSILYKTPADDLEFWYKNIKASHDELSQIDSTTTQLEKSNILLKLRETLLDHGKNGDKVTDPKGISIYPSNTLYCIWGWISGILMVLSGLVVFKQY